MATVLLINTKNNKNHSNNCILTIITDKEQPLQYTWSMNLGIIRWNFELKSFVNK